MAKVSNSITFSTGGGNNITVVANYSALPDPITVSGEFYWCSASQGTSWLPGSLGGTFYNNGLYYSNGTTWEFLNVPFNATQSEVNTGTNNDKFVTPSTLAGWWTNIKTLAQSISGLWTFGNGIVFTPSSAPTHQEGKVYYDTDAKSLTYYDDISGTAVNIGQEEFIRARNNSGSTITNGSVVYVTGALGQNPTIALAKADSLSTCTVIGIATHDIANNTVGKVTTFGLVNDLNTSAFTDGQQLYLSASTAGALTATVPSSPNYTVYVCNVLHSHVTQGKLAVRPEAPIALNTALTDDNKVSPSVTAVKTYVDAKKTRIFLASDITNNTVADADITGFTFTIPASGKCDFRVCLPFTSAATGTGINVGVKIVTGVGANGNVLGNVLTKTRLSTSTVGWVVNVVEQGANATVSYGALSGVSTAGLTNVVELDCDLTNLATNTSVTIQIVFASEVALSAVDVKKGSSMIINL